MPRVRRQLEVFDEDDASRLWVKGAVAEVGRADERTASVHDEKLGVEHRTEASMLRGQRQRRAPATAPNGFDCGPE